jgi:hypothetical protein
MIPADDLESAIRSVESLSHSVAARLESEDFAPGAVPEDIHLCKELRLTARVLLSKLYVARTLCGSATEHSPSVDQRSREV